MQQSTKMFKHISKKWVFSSVAVVLVVAVGISTIMIYKNKTSNTSKVQQRTVTVSKGNIEVSLSGSGTVESASTSDLMSNVEGKITKAYFKEGDSIKKGDLLFEIDDTNAKLNIQKIQNQISQAQLNTNSTNKTFSNLIVTAPISGKVTGLTASVGDGVNNGMSLLTITDTEHLQLDVPINLNDISSVKEGQKVQIHIQDLFDTVTGTVTSIDNNTYTASNGGLVKNVVVSVTNPGRLSSGMTASADISTDNGVKSSCENAKFEYANKQTVKVYASGTIEQLNVKENQHVQKGIALARLSNDDLQVSQMTNDLKVQDLGNQLAAAQKALEDYKIYSAIDGTLTTLSAEQGDSVKAGSALASIRNFNEMQFVISVDELDIEKVKVGQKASITIDALTETTKKPLSGEVIKKAMEGSSSNGVATYNVTIKINETQNLLAGMNANASIILNSAENVLKVPLEAITKMGDKAFVRIKSTSGSQQNSEFNPNNPGSRPNGDPKSGDRQNGTPPSMPQDSSASNNRSSRSNRSNWSASSSSTSSGKRNTSSLPNQQYYANTVMKQVELGINNDEYVEIKSGLSLNDVIILPPLVSSSSSSSSSFSSPAQGLGGFGIGGMGGGMNMGGPPDRMGSNTSGSRSSNRSSSSNKN